MESAKYLITAILIIVSTQIVTYSIFGKQILINKIGKNADSAILQYPDNRFDKFFFVTDINTNGDKVLRHFDKISKRCDGKIEVYPTIESCDYMRGSDYFYCNFVKEQTIIPFFAKKIEEAEGAKEFGAAWDSVYVWVFFRWFLVDKAMTGIS